LINAGTSADDADYLDPFAFTGKLGKITVDLGESSVTPQARGWRGSGIGKGGGNDA
jgi:hypothetical protein